MNKRRIRFWASLVVLMIVLVLLYTGSPLLEYSLKDTPYIPAGTLITWLGMTAVPLSVYWGCKGLREPKATIRKYLAAFLKLILLLAVLWAPICFLLAGNWAYNFSESSGFQGGQEAMRWFWRLSYSIPIASLLVLIAYCVLALTQKLGRNS